MVENEEKNGHLKLKLGIQNLLKRLGGFPNYCFCSNLWGRDYHVFLDLFYFTLDTKREDFFQRCLKLMAKFAFYHTSDSLQDRIFIANHMRALMPRSPESEQELKLRYISWLAKFYILLLKKIRSERHPVDYNLHKENVVALKQLIKLIFNVLNDIVGLGQRIDAILLDEVVQILIKIDPDPTYGYGELKDEIIEFARWIGAYAAEFAPDLVRSWLFQLSAQAPKVCENIAQGVIRFHTKQKGEISTALAQLG